MPSTDETVSRRTFTIDEVAEILGIGRNQAYDAAKAKQIATVKIGRRILVPKAALERLLSGEAA